MRSLFVRGRVPVPGGASRRAGPLFDRNAGRGRTVFHWVNYQAFPPVRESTSASVISRVEIHDIPAIEDEPFKPDERALAGRLVIGFDPGPDGKFRGSFKSWADVGAWYEELCAVRRVPDTVIGEKARLLTADLPDKASVIRPWPGSSRRRSAMWPSSRHRGISAPPGPEHPDQPLWRL